jgi:hypothetical protein
MKILKFGTLSTRYERCHGREIARLVVSHFNVHCEGAGYEEDAWGCVDPNGLRFQRDLLNAILLNIIEGNYDPGIGVSRAVAGAAIERAMGSDPPAPRAWWRFWR